MAGIGARIAERVAVFDGIAGRTRGERYLLQQISAFGHLIQVNPRSQVLMDHGPA